MLYILRNLSGLFSIFTLVTVRESTYYSCLHNQNIPLTLNVLDYVIQSLKVKEMLIIYIVFFAIGKSDRRTIAVTRKMTLIEGRYQYLMNSVTTQLYLFRFKTPNILLGNAYSDGGFSLSLAESRYQNEESGHSENYIYEVVVTVLGKLLFSWLPEIGR